MGKLSIALGAVAVVFGTACIVLAWRYWPEPSPKKTEFTPWRPPRKFAHQTPISFDADRWKRAQDRQAHFARLRMLEDLFDRYELLGMEADSVEELLGPLKWGLSRDAGFSYLYEVADPWGRPSDFVLNLDKEYSVVSALVNWGRTGDIMRFPGDEDLISGWWALERTGR